MIYNIWRLCDQQLLARGICDQFNSAKPFRRRLWFRFGPYSVLIRIYHSRQVRVSDKTKWQGEKCLSFLVEIWSQSERFKYKKWYSCVSTSNNFPPPHPYLKIQKNESETDWLWGNILQYKVHVSQTNNLIRCDGW